jgi:hypothetical protein
MSHDFFYYKTATLIGVKLKATLISAKIKTLQDDQSLV